jgi:diadenosine tetraphosphate (Ap4A) HIT family hydrolase
MNPRQYSLCKYIGHPANGVFPEKDIYVFLGDIPNMPGHCVVLNHRTGKVYSGYHTENFVELSEDEV